MKYPKLTKEQSQKCEGKITEKELLKALKKMPQNKLPGNDGITKEFDEEFWDDVNEAFKVGELISSKKQAVLNLILKKTKINDLLKI